MYAVKQTKSSQPAGVVTYIVDDGRSFATILASTLDIDAKVAKRIADALNIVEKLAEAYRSPRLPLDEVVAYERLAKAADDLLSFGA